MINQSANLKPVIVTNQISTMTNLTRSTIDQADVDRFSAMADEWWDPTGKFKPLHKFNPVRLSYIKQKVCENFDLDPNQSEPFRNLTILDIGCGGGLLCEPMARLGAKITGVDASSTNIEIARIHARQTSLDIDYRVSTSESLNEHGETFDCILNMEVVEHVADVDLFINSCANMVKPGGLMFVATINRTFKANALAIFMAENILKWLPKGTHQFEKLVRPEELEVPLNNSGMQIIDRTGVFYNPITDKWDYSKDMDVNYMILARR